MYEISKRENRKDSEYSSYPSINQSNHEVSPLKTSAIETILQLKLTNHEENIAFNQNFIYKMEKDNASSNFSIPNYDTPSGRKLKTQSPLILHKESFHIEKKASYSPSLFQDQNDQIARTNLLEAPKIGFSVNKQENYTSECPSPSANPKHGLNEILVPVLKKFLMKLKNASFYRPITGLKAEQFELLDDSAYFLEKRVKESKFRTWAKAVKNSQWAQTLLKGQTIDPYHPLKTLWDILHLLILMMMIFFIPLQVAFLNNQFHNIKNWIYTISLIFFCWDLIINMNTGYFSDGILVKLKKDILKHYLKKGMFCSDLCGILALLISNFSFPESRFVPIGGLLVFGKMARLKWIYSKLTSQFKLQTRMKGYLDLLKLLMTSLLVLHILACFWLMIGALDYEENRNPDHTWLSFRGLLVEKWYFQYLYAFYWAVVTMMTVGYGDIAPKSGIETVYTTITIILGCGVYGYYLNTVGILLQDIHKEENKYNSNLKVINMFMDRKEIDNELQMRVREYLRFIWDEEKTQNDEEEAKIINSLNLNLKEELLLKAYGRILKQFPMFYANFSEKSLRKMVIFMKEVRFIPGDLVFFEQELDDSAIYFINKGAVELFLSRTDKNIPHSLRKLTTGDCFGELGFFSGQPRESSARSLEFISVFMIKRSDFLEIIKENEDDYQKFCMIRDQIMLYGNSQSLRLRCSGCGSLDHLVKQCGLLHFIPDIEKIIKKYEYYTEQPRIPNPRCVEKRPNGMGNYRRLQKNALRIQKEMKKDKENEKNEFIRKKFMKGDYDTLYFNSEASISSEEGSESLDDDENSSGEGESVGETNTIRTDTFKASKPGTSFENLMKQSMDSSNVDHLVLFSFFFKGIFFLF